MDWYLSVFRDYKNFQGRTSRKEFMIFSIINILILMTLRILDGQLGNDRSSVGFEAVTMLFCLAVYIPSLALSVRRLHDTDRSGDWLGLLFVPLIGVFIVFVFLLQPGTRGANQFGPSPLDEEATAGPSLEH